MLEIVFWWARIIYLEALPNNMWWCRSCLTFLKGFLTPRLNYFLQFSSCGRWRVFSHSNSPSHHVLGRYRHTSSSFHCSSSFLKATSLICEAQLSFAAHQKYIIIFSRCDGWLREFGLCFPSYLYFCETGSHGWIMFIITLEFSKLWILMGIYFRDIFLIRIYRGANNCVQCVWYFFFIS